jgi:hypothetical protein
MVVDVGSFASDIEENGRRMKEEEMKVRLSEERNERSSRNPFEWGTEGEQVDS